MQPTYLPLVSVFGTQTRQVVPLFQRPYVWSQEEQWEPLWEDLRGLADRVLRARTETIESDGSVRTRRLAECRRGPEVIVSVRTLRTPTGKPVAGHFLGTVVLEQAQTPTGSVAAREVIDGQQRLTTLQIVLHAAQHVLNELQGTATTGGGEAVNKAANVASRQIAALTANPAYADEEERYKVWPTNEDRAAYRQV